MISQLAVAHHPLSAASAAVLVAAVFSEVICMNCRATQNERLLAYLERHGTITRWPAFSKLGIANLWARIAELREEGHKIKDRRVTTRSGAHVKEYELVGRKRAA